MNASFRTAFWALCLGLTVPMALFVGVELTSGGRPPAARQAGALPAGSLQALWSGNRKSAAARPVGARLDKRLETDADEPAGGVARATLDPPDDSEGLPHGAQVLSTASRPRADLVPDAVYSLGPTAPERIEAQLEQILRHMQRLSDRPADCPPGSDAPAAPAEFLQRLRELERTAQIAALLATGQSREPAGPLPAVPADDRGASAGPVPGGGLPPATDAARAAEQSLQSKVYCPRHVSVRALAALVRPLLTPDLGRLGAAGSDEETPSPDGSLPDESPASGEALVVRDTPDVLRKIDLLVQQLDVRPARVLLEATLLLVESAADAPSGIDLARFNGGGRPYSVTPLDAPRSHAASAPGGMALTHGTALKCGIVRGDVRDFLQTVEASTPVRGVSSAQVSLLGRQSADLRMDGTGTALAAGFHLRVRTDVTSDGRIRLRLHEGTAADKGSSTADSNLRVRAMTRHLMLDPEETAALGGYFPAPATGPRDPAAPESTAGPRLEVLPDPAGPRRWEVLVLLTPHLVDPGGGQHSAARRARGGTPPSAADRATRHATATGTTGTIRPDSK